MLDLPADSLVTSWGRPRGHRASQVIVEQGHGEGSVTVRRAEDHPFRDQFYTYISLNETKHTLPTRDLSKASVSFICLLLYQLDRVLYTRVRSSVSKRDPNAWKTLLDQLSKLGGGRHGECPALPPFKLFGEASCQAKHMRMHIC